MSSTNAGPSKPPVKPPVVQPGSGNAIVINPCQRLNPMLECIRNVSKEFGDIIPDFQLGRTTCALFLSLKYHRLHPEYIHQRIQRLGNAYNLRILLLMCDIDQHQDPIRELTKICLINNMTIIVCWSNEEAGMYLATYKAFEHKSADLIKERVDKDYNAILRSALTSISKVNKMDVETLRAAFGSFANIARGTDQQLRSLPGFGQVKVRRVKDAFEKPFRNKATSSISEAFTDDPEPGSSHIASSTTNVESNSSANQDKTSEKASGSHRFGSAADINPRLAAKDLHVCPESPPWDIELDLNDETANASTKVAENVQGNSSTSSSRPPRSPSPVWDIELDLNDD